MSEPEKIQSFVQRACARLNRFRLFDTLFWSFTVGAALLVLVGLTYVLRGHPVPKFWYAVAIAAAVGAAFGIAAVRRWSSDGAAHFADGFFGLKDSLASWLHFHKDKREGDFYSLQEHATAERVADLNVDNIRYQKPRRLMVCLGLLTMCALLMAFKQASPEVLAQQAEEAQTLEHTGLINEHLEDVIDELAKGLTEEEKEALNPDELRELIKNLKETKDTKEAMRQYAEIERKINAKAAKLEQRKNEQLMAKAGEELKKDEATKEAGKKLSEKDYKKAAEELKKLEPQKIDPKKLSEAKKDLAKLKAAAQRMAAAAKAAGRKGSASASPKPGDKSAKASKSMAKASKASGSGQGKANGQGGSSSGEGDGDMAQQIADLEAAVKEFEGALKEAMLQEQQFGKCDAGTLGQCNASQFMLTDQLNQMGDKLYRMQTMSDMQKKLLGLCKKIGQCQGGMCDKASLMACLGAKPGGKKAGVGSVESRRSETDELVDNGQTSLLQGQKNAGPSESTVEAADEGSGVATRQAGTRERDFQRQLESFVQREDVPDDVKEGVKAYFKNIHQADQ